MTDYELATLSIREWGLWAAFGQIAATVAIGLGQIAIVWFGIRIMRQAGDRRAKEQDQRHDETMLALRELIDSQRDDRRQHAQALDALIRQSDANALALRTLIERTGRPEPASGSPS